MNRKAFTLIELLFVMAIIAMVISLMAPAVVSIKRKALMVNCQSNMHQIYHFIQMYASDYDDIIPFVKYIDIPGPGAIEDHQIPTLADVLYPKYIDNKEVLKCPSDTGCPNQDYYPTPPGVSCFEYYGQSYAYNSTQYIEPGAPGYDPSKTGELYGAKPLSMGSVVNPHKYVLLFDMWPHWHGSASGTGGSSSYHINMLFYDSHVGGKSFGSAEAAKTFIYQDSTLRWWKDPLFNPVPVSE